jgi:hypothetical protein
MRFSGKFVIAALFALVSVATTGLVLWAKHTPVPPQVMERTPGRAMPGVLN